MAPPAQRLGAVTVLSPSRLAAGANLSHGGSPAYAGDKPPLCICRYDLNATDLNSQGIIARAQQGR
jgi:hypothetical protein